MNKPEQLEQHPERAIAHAGTVSHRLIFCISSGRSGSDYLRRLLSTAPNVSAFHEPQPDMSGEYLAMVMEQSLEKTKERRILKADALKQDLAGMPARQIYAETNHMFIKTFHD